MTTIATTPAETQPYSPARIAELVEQAADLIDRHGLEQGDFWPTATVGGYERGLSCCTVGALAITCGYDTPRRVEYDFVGLSYTDLDTCEMVPARAPHPVLAAVMYDLCCTEVEQLYAWSDSARDDQVVERLRAVALHLRRRQDAVA